MDSLARIDGQSAEYRKISLLIARSYIICWYYDPPVYPLYLSACLSTSTQAKAFVLLPLGVSFCPYVRVPCTKISQTIYSLLKGLFFTKARAYHRAPHFPSQEQIEATHYRTAPR